jgi:multimeric flavodoxin WrbA
VPGKKECMKKKSWINSTKNRVHHIKDDIAPIYKKIAQADALLLGAPIYLGAVNGMMHSFFERLLFPNQSYGAPVANPNR